MKMDVFQMERMQSTWENLVEYDLSESGVRPVTLQEMIDLGFDLAAILRTPLGYSQSDGTPALKQELMKIYPGAAPENIEVTNGTSEANYLVALTLIRDGDGFAMEIPNYMQLWGIPPSLGARAATFRLRHEAGWEPDWEEFEKAVRPGTRLVYVSNPNNPTGSILSEEAMRRIVRGCEKAGAYLIADEVYLGAEIERARTASFWGMSDRVIVTSGLSKAYGLPGARIGWIIGPPGIVADCWSQHDYITICPNKISDAVARVAVRPDNRERLYARTRAILRENLPILRAWVASLGPGFTFRDPEAGAIVLMKYDAPLPSADLAERIRRNRSVLIVPGAHLGAEGFLRLWFGGRPDHLREGLGRIREEIRSGLPAAS